MAGTIITTPSLGASDWSDWITQQERTDRGFMRVSLTNFSGTAASSIGTGSVMECAGSIYQFTETAISLATGTASADVAVYFQVIPSAGGTTCTVAMDSTAPTWVDAKQGFYASAASNTRVIGGCYIATAATYYCKFLYTDDLVNQLVGNGKTRPLFQLAFELGEWDMDATASLDIQTGIPRSRVRYAGAFVRTDAGIVYGLTNFQGGSAEAAGYVSWNATDNLTYVTVARVTNGTYDSLTFNGTASTVANRGWVYIEYEA